MQWNTLKLLSKYQDVKEKKYRTFSIIGISRHTIQYVCGSIGDSKVLIMVLGDKKWGNLLLPP